MKFWFWFIVIALAIFGAVKLGIAAATFAWFTVVFAVGSFGFWGLLVACVLISWFLEATSWEEDSPAALALIPFAAFCLIAHFVSRVDMIAWVKGHLAYAATRVGWYFAIGFVFFTIRWITHIVQKRSELDSEEALFRKKHPFDGPLNEAPESVKLAFTEFLTGRYSADVKEIEKRREFDPATHGVRPLVGRNWRAIACWLFWWPFEVPRYFFGELWADIMRGLREFFGDIFDWFTKRYFGKRNAYVLTEEQIQKIRQKEREERTR